MSMDAALELLVERRDDRVLLLAPDVGLFTEAAPPGALLAEGQRAGTLLRLGRPAPLHVPAGVAGRVVTPLPDRVRAPVGYRDVLYELAPLEAGGPTESRPADRPTEQALVVHSPQSGRFYHRASPDEPAFVSPGDVLEEGRPVGLIEVMKTFALVPYRAHGRLPRRARVVRHVAPDGGEVAEGSPLVEVEPVDGRVPG